LHDTQKKTFVTRSALLDQRVTFELQVIPSWEILSWAMCAKHRIKSYYCSSQITKCVYERIHTRAHKHARKRLTHTYTHIYVCVCVCVYHSVICLRTGP